jgi:RNA polymerase sigma-70 factor (ECF subfamily)
VSGSDAALVARITAGDEHALAEVFDAMAPLVYEAARRVVGHEAQAQDVVQDVFVQLWTHPERYDSRLSALGTYLSVLARSRAVDLLRSELRRLARQERHWRLHPQTPSASAHEEVATAEAKTLVRRAVEQLPPDQRRVVELAYFQGLSYREVAVAEGIPEGTAKSRIRLALTKLEAVLDRQLLEQS